MNFSCNWLRELVEGLDQSPSELMSLITIKTAECEGVHAVGAHLAGVCAARVESAEPIEGSKNQKAVVDTGRYGRKTVVCGAPNCRAGMVTAYVPAGTLLEGREIRRAVIAGVESDGMLASGAELGINRDAAGILEVQLEPGASLGPAPDFVIEVDNKSLTHRPDLWGHYGMAREVSAITRHALIDPVNTALLPEGAPGIEVRIDAPGLCPRYSALVFENVTVGPSPLWLQARLEAIGLNPISNIVDVTNYVMAELAQPMHAFDADKLHGGIVVRHASPGEHIEALNHEEYELPGTALVIADGNGAVAVAGVIGGLGSAIGPGTRRIVLESANFHAASVRRTSSELKLRTDASIRFEKAQDPANTIRGLARAVALLQEVSPGIRIAGGIADVFQSQPDLPIIELPLGWLDRKIGRHVAPSEVRGILGALQFGVDEVSPEVLQVSVPSWRATKDVSVREDLVEEVGRMIGYASIPPQAPLLPASVPRVNPVRRYHHGLRTSVAAQGFDEVYNYSFISEETIGRFGLAPEDHVRVRNPIASDQTHLRTTLIPGIWKNITDNARYLDSFRLFEIGVEVHKRGVGELPNEIHHLAAAVFEKDGDTAPVFELKHLAESVAPEVETRPVTETRAYEHPARTAALTLGGTPVGRLFEFHPRFVERGRAAVLDLDLDALMRLTQIVHQYRPLQRFPSSAFDLSVIVPARALTGTVQSEMASFVPDHLESVTFVRQYAGPPLPEGMKSLSYRLTVAASDRTLSSEEVGAIRQRIIDAMRGLGHDLRV